jgi:delta8-fatty-acid desaturase
MMTKHRIGRVDLPWANLEPPIRSPDYYINLEKRTRALKKEASAGHTDLNVPSRRSKSIDVSSVGSLPFVRRRACDRLRDRCGPFRVWLMLW